MTNVCGSYHEATIANSTSKEVSKETKQKVYLPNTKVIMASTCLHSSYLIPMYCATTLRADQHINNISRHSNFSNHFSKSSSIHDQ